MMLRTRMALRPRKVYARGGSIVKFESVGEVFFSGFLGWSVGSFLSKRNEEKIKMGDAPAPRTSSQ